jgi:hypothetical protein
MKIHRLALTLCLASAPAHAATLTSQEFAGQTFTMELPEGYSLLAAASPEASARTFGFATEVRPDGTRGMIQVTLIAHDQTELAGRVDITKIATAMIGGVRARRTQWTSTEKDEELGGVAVRRIEWSSVSPVPIERDGRPVPVPMSGIMIVGMKGPLVFALHTQDVEPFARQAHPVAERAMRTFALEPQ